MPSRDITTEKIYQWEHICWASIISRVPSMVVMLHVSDRARFGANTFRTRMSHESNPSISRIHWNIERHTLHTIVSWPNPKQWVIVHTSYLMIIIRQSVYIISIITGEMGKLKAPHIVYWIIEKNMLYRTHTLDRIYLTFYNRVRIFCDVLYHLSRWQASAQMLLVQATAYYTNEGWVKTVQVMTGWLDSIIAI